MCISKPKDGGGWKMCGCCDTYTAVIWVFVTLIIEIIIECIFGLWIEVAVECLMLIPFIIVFNDKDNINKRRCLMIFMIVVFVLECIGVVIIWLFFWWLFYMATYIYLGVLLLFNIW